MYFRSCKYNTGPISEPKTGFELIFEIGVFKRKKFCLRFKSFKSSSNEYVFVLTLALPVFIRVE